MKTTRIVVGILILAAIAFEIYAAFDPSVWTISQYFWSEGPDKYMVGAPIIALLGFLCGHLVWPLRKATRKPRELPTLHAVLIGVWMAYEVTAWAFLPSLQWTTSRMVYHWLSWIGIPGVDVFAIHFLAGHFVWTR